MRIGVTKKLVIAYHDLSVLLEAGIPILRSLNVITANMTGHLQKVFSSLADSVSKGNTLSNSMVKHRDVFGSLDIMLTEAAETSGDLHKPFKQLAQWYEFIGRIELKIISGLALPLMLIHIAAFVGPAPLMFLGRISFYRYLSEVISILAVFYIPFGLVIAIIVFRPERGLLRKFLDIFVLRIPLLGQAVEQFAIARYCRTFNMLYKAGVPITKCAQKAPTVTGNLVIAERFKGGALSAQSGNMVFEGFSRSLPLELLNLWEIAEQSGQLDDSVERLGNTFADNAEFLFQQFAQWLARLVYLIVSVYIALQIFRIASTMPMR